MAAIKTADLNPVNYKIWEVMQNWVHKCRVSNVDELKQRLVEVWMICSRLSLTRLSASGDSDWSRACVHRDDIFSTCYQPVLDWKNFCVNRILFNVVYSQNNRLLAAKFVIFCVLWFPEGKDRWGGNETIFPWRIVWLLSVPKIIVMGHLLFKLL